MSLDEADGDVVCFLLHCASLAISCILILRCTSWDVSVAGFPWERVEVNEAPAAHFLLHGCSCLDAT
jgi:hypothetical protein